MYVFQCTCFDSKMRTSGFFLKNLLQFMKIKLKARKLPVDCFTVFEKNKKISIPVLKSKFFALTAKAIVNNP